MRQDRNDPWDDCKSSRRWYTRLDNHWTWDPDIVCNPCKCQAHSAPNCDMLALALFLEKYVKVFMTPTIRNRIEAAWLQQ
jgi:hypothetical protein